MSWYVKCYCKKSGFTPPTTPVPEKPKLSRNEIIKQLIQTTTGESDADKKDELLEQLAECDSRDANVWGLILDYWTVANAEGFVNQYEFLPIRPQEETDMVKDKSVIKWWKKGELSP